MIKSYNIPSEHVPELIAVFGQNWTETVLDQNGQEVPNPETKGEYAERIFDTEIINNVKRRVQDYRKRQLMQSLDETVIIEKQ